MSYLLTGAQCIDGRGNPPALSDILIVKDRIHTVGSGAREAAAAFKDVTVLDLTGGTIMPGLIDSHCHITFDQPESNDELFFHRRNGLGALVAAVNARKVLRSGVTGFFDADCIFDVGIDLRDAIESGVVEGPRMCTGGNVLINCVGGTAARLLPDNGRRGYGVIVHTPSEIVTEIHHQVKAGVDWIKVHVSGAPIRPGKNSGEVQTWSYDELKLVCDTAHQLNIPVVGHCRTASSTRDAARAGFDMILHATYMDEEALEAVIERKVPLVPTFTFQANLADYGGLVGTDANLQEFFRREITESQETMRAAYDAGVPLLTGSESGFSITPYGDWHWRELQIFVDYLGMTPLQAIQAATYEGARALKLEGEVGVVESGYLADLLVVDGNPADDVSILGDRHRVRNVFKGGKDIDLEQPIPDNWDIPGWRVSEFSTRRLTRELVDREMDDS